MNNPRITLNQKLPALANGKKPSTRNVLAAMAIVMAVAGIANIYFLYGSIALLSFLTVSYINNLLKEIMSVDFNNDKYEVTMEDIIEDLENSAK